MLTEKNYRDFCDEETENELVKLGFPIEHACLQGSGIYVTIHISLYEAQKFLREEKEAYVTVIPEYNEFGPIKGVKYRLEVAYWKDDEFGYETIEWLDEECPHTIITFDSYEEALSEGVRQAIEILKDKQ